MLTKLRKAASFVTTIVAVAAVPYASAQVTVNLTTTQQTTCVATTDVNGLTLVPGTTELQATGVTLNGTGCGSNGSGGSDFDTTVTAPTSATAGTAFPVVWTASSNATLCTFSGTSGAIGWPVGANACTGSACAGSHTRAVTAPATGSFAFAMTCTNASGFGLSEGTTVNGPPGQPPTPPNFALTVPQAVTVNVPFQVSWNVQNATTCSGTASRDGSSTNLSGWTDSTSASSPRTVTATQGGSYSLQLTCRNSSGSVTSTPATTLASTAGAGCPANQQTSLSVCTSQSGTFANCTTEDATQYVNIWGQMAGSFPGDNLAKYLKNVDSTKYIAARFTVPASSDRYGEFTQSSVSSSPGLTMKLSESCGDFQPDSSFCYKTSTAGNFLTKWRTPAGTGSRCLLTPGRTYYVNLKITQPTSPTGTCTGSVCRVGVINNHSPN